MVPDEMLIFGGSASVHLTRQICAYLGVEPSANEVLRFSDGNIFVRILRNVRGRRVYLVQSTAFPTNDNFMELLFWIDACKRASAASVTVIIPYFSYAKGDKKDEPRVSIRARVCADALEAAGADRIVTMDLHAPQIQGFFHVPVDDLYALPLLGTAIQAKHWPDLVVVSPDTGFAKKARQYARYLGGGLALAVKERLGHDEQPAVLEVIGDVAGKTALIVDDFTTSAGTLVEVARELQQRGATAIHAAVTHGVFAPGAMQRIMDSAIQTVFVTDTVETQPEPHCAKIEVVSAAALFGEAIVRIHNCESISDLFPVKSRTR